MEQRIIMGCKGEKNDRIGCSVGLERAKKCTLKVAKENVMEGKKGHIESKIS